MGNSWVPLCLSGAVQPFLGPGPLDDLLSVAVADRGARLALLVPEPVEPPVELVELSGKLGIMTFGEPVPELGPALGRILDLDADVFE